MWVRHRDIYTLLRACLGAVLLAVAGSVLVQSIAPTPAFAQIDERMRREISRHEGMLAKIRDLRPDDPNYALIRLRGWPTAVPVKQWYRIYTNEYLYRESPALRRQMSLRQYLRRNMRKSNAIKAQLRRKRTETRRRLANLRRRLRGQSLGPGPGKDRFCSSYANISMRQRRDSRAPGCRVYFSGPYWLLHTWQGNYEWCRSNRRIAGQILNKRTRQLRAACPPVRRRPPTTRRCETVCVRRITKYYASDNRHRTCCAGGRRNPRCLGVTCRAVSECVQSRRQCR